MNVKPMLGDWEIPRIAAIRSRERRAFVEHAVPGRSGSLWQDLDSDPLALCLEGSLFGDETRNDFLEQVRTRFRAGVPLTFVADIVTATDLQYVVVEGMDFRESGSRPDQTDYRILLRQSPPPPPPPDPLGGLDAGLLDQAAGFADSITGALDVMEGLVDLATSGFPNFGDPTAPLSGAIDAVKAATTGLDEIAGTLKGLFG